MSKVGFDVISCKSETQNVKPEIVCLETRVWGEKKSHSHHMTGLTQSSYITHMSRV